MPCPYFRGDPDCRCAAVSGEIVPSLHERERFCMSSCDRCPTFLARQQAGEPILEDHYYDLWLAPGADAEQSLYTPDDSMCI
jgi:hypothetical protein